MIYCKKCGTQLPDDAVYCIKCGTKVEHPTTSTDTDKTQELPNLANEADNLTKKAPDEPLDTLMTSSPKEPKKNRSKLPRDFVGIALGGIILFGGFCIAYPLFNKPSPTPKSEQVITSSARQQTPSEKKAAEEKAAADKKAHEEAIKPPVTLDSITVTPNSIGEPQVHLTLTNRSQKTIDALKVKIYAYDNYGTQLKEFGYGADAFNGISQDSIPSGATTNDGRVWTLHGFDNGRKFVVRLMSLHFSDGTEWTTELDQQVTVEGKMKS